MIEPIVIVEKTSTMFPEKFRPFRDLSSDYHLLWEVLLDAVANARMLTIICANNDRLEIPPVLSWVQLNREKIERLKEQDESHRYFDSSGEFHPWMKQRIGAFWRTVFMVLGYEQKKKVSITGHNAFGLSSASRFEKDGDISTYQRINIH